MRRRPQRSPSVPDTSITAAKGSRYAVTDIDAVPADTPWVAPSSGSIATVTPPPNGPRKAPP